MVETVFMVITIICAVVAVIALVLTFIAEDGGADQGKALGVIFISVIAGLLAFIAASIAGSQDTYNELEQTVKELGVIGEVDINKLMSDKTLLLNTGDRLVLIEDGSVIITK